MKPVLIFSALFVMTACSKEQARPDIKPLDDVLFSIETSPDSLFQAPRAAAAESSQASGRENCISNNIESGGEYIREIFCEPKPCFMSFEIESNQKDFVPIIRLISEGYWRSLKRAFPNADYSESEGCKRAAGENEDGAAKMMFCEPEDGHIVLRMDIDHKKAAMQVWETRSSMMAALKTSLKRKIPPGFSAFPEDDRRLFTSCRARDGGA